MISLARYAALLAKPELKGAILASIIGRLPIGMAGLAIMLTVQATSGSFVRAGVVSAMYVAGLGFIAPLLGRAIDRAGPRRTLAVCAVGYPAMLCLLVVAVNLAAPLPIVLSAAFAAGACYPPITSSMRTFIRQRLDDDALLSAAFSLESLLIETIFIVGPVFVAMFVAWHSAQAAVLFGAACVLVGTVLFLNSAALKLWTIAPRLPASMFGPLPERGFPALLLTIVCYASAFGLAEIGVMGYAAQLHRPAFAGVLLALMSVGSATGALVYGSRTWHAPLHRQFATMLLVMGAGVAVLGAFDNEWLFAAMCVIAGVVMAPALIIQAMLVSSIAPQQHATEAFTWSSTALLAGVSAGLALGGWFLETLPPAAVFAAAGIASGAAAAFAMVLLGRR